MYTHEWSGRRFGFPLFPMVFVLLALIVFLSHPVLFLAVPLTFFAFAFLRHGARWHRGGWHEGWAQGGEARKFKRDEPVDDTRSYDRGEIRYL